MSDNPTPIEVFCSYAPADEHFYLDLETHLSILRRQKRVALWNHRKLVGGVNWEEEVDEHLENAAVILLLVSADFLASDYCYGVEMDRALERARLKQACVVPILIRPASLKGAPFSHLMPLPRNGTPIASWRDRDEAFFGVAEELRAVLDSLPTTISPFPPVRVSRP